MARVVDNTIRGRGRSGRPWERAKAHCKATRPPICWVCDLPIDMRANPKRDPLAWTAHHILPLNAGGDPLDPANIWPAHRWCNTSAADQPVTTEVRTRCHRAITSLYARRTGPTEPATTRTL